MNNKQAIYKISPFFNFQIRWYWLTLIPNYHFYHWNFSKTTFTYKILYEITLTHQVGPGKSKISFFAISGSSKIIVYTNIQIHVTRSIFIVNWFFLKLKIQKQTYLSQDHPIESNSTSFWFNFFFLGWIIKKLRRGAQGALLLFLYEMSIVVLIDFIAGIFLIQIVNTNMYLIYFFSKNIIKMHFPLFFF